MTAPRTPSHLNFSLLTLFLLALAHPAQAQPTPDPALQADLAYTAASAALSQQNWAEAELHYERVLMFNPLHAEARVQLALLFAQQGKTTAAASFLQSLVDDPRTPSAHRVRLQALLAQLASQPAPVPDPLLHPAPQTAPRAEAKLSLGYTTNPYARADLSSLTLTLPEGRADFPIEQNLSPAALVTASLSYLWPNQCGFDLHRQNWGGKEPQTNHRLLLFCNTKMQGEHLQLFASTQQSTDGFERTTAGASWPASSWRLTAQVFKEPMLERQGYGLRIDHLLHDRQGTSTQLFAEAENTTTSALPGFVKAGLLQAVPLTPALSAWALFTYQQDLGAYSPLLENGATRRLLLTQATLERSLGTFSGWQIGSALQITNRKSNIELFKFTDLNVKITLKHLF
jgi:hypothetical protein